MRLPDWCPVDWLLLFLILMDIVIAIRLMVN